MNKVAVTGASGLIGWHIVEKLAAEGVDTVALCRNPPALPFPQQVVIKKSDIMDPFSLDEALEGVDAVIHAAAFVSFNPRRRNQIFDVNVVGTRNVVDACLRKGIKNLVHISSVAALGRKVGEIVTEETRWTGYIASDYARSKYLSELEAFRGGEEGLNVTMVNPSFVLTTTQLHRSSATLFDYVWKSNRFFTDGAVNYVDARDVADVTFRLLKSPSPGEKFIVSAGTLSYREFFAHIARELGKRPPSIRISSGVAAWYGLAEEVRSFLFGKEPVVTRQSARISATSFQYDNSKVQRVTGIRFRELADTLSWCCDTYKQNIQKDK